MNHWQRTLICAWILWSSTLHSGSTWSPLRAYDTKAECEAAEREATRRADALVPYNWSFRCLPDTVRP